MNESSSNDLFGSPDKMSKNVREERMICGMLCSHLDQSEILCIGYNPALAIIAYCLGWAKDRHNRI